MPRYPSSKKIYAARSFKQLCQPLASILPNAPLLESRCKGTLQMEFEH